MTGAIMATSISIASFSGATIVTVGGLPLPSQSFIGDWEGRWWGDGKFPGIAAVSAIATLRLGAELTAELPIRNNLTEAADKLSLLLADQIELFVQALKVAA